jgi:hypothetical protein
MCEFDGIDWDDWMIIGPVSEDIAKEKRDRDWAYRDMFEDDDGVIFDKD